MTLMLTGQYWWTFWILQMAIGMIIPAAILFSPLKHKPGWIVAMPNPSWSATDEYRP